MEGPGRVSIVMKGILPRWKPEGKAHWLRGIRPV